MKKSKKDGDSKKPNVKSLRTEFDRLRRGKNLPSPAWIFVGPIVQVTHLPHPMLILSKTADQDVHRDLIALICCILRCY